MKNLEDTQPSIEELQEIEDDISETIKESKATCNDELYSSVDSFKIYLHEIGDCKLLTPEQELEYARRYKYNNDIEAKQILIKHNLRLVVSIAKKYASRGVELPDLVQEGSLGLIKGIELFDPDMGFRLSTYCTWWIRQIILRYLANNGRTIRLPVHMNEKVSRYVAFIGDYRKENNGVCPSDDEIAEALNMTVEQVRTLASYTKDLISLDAKVNNEDGTDTTFGDFVPDNSNNPEEEAMNGALRNDIEDILSSLTKREADVLKMRFGIGDTRPHTLEEVGAVLGVTRERVRQIEAKAIRKLRHPSRAKKLRDYMPGAKMPSFKDDLSIRG